MITFDHVYVERSARDYPLTRDVLSRLSSPHVTEIDDANAFFKRPGQDFALQKRAPKLILARKRGTYLYRGNERIASFGAERALFYTDIVRNCLFDCDYCFLQGMHPSANILLNVNIEDYLEAVTTHMTRYGELYLSISYLSDLLGFERHFGLVRRWIEASRNIRGVEIEVRTKSDGFSTLHDVAPHKGVILTWSLSPDALARGHEAGTGGFAQRLFDARRAALRGWRVRLCFDPVIVAESWRDDYRRAVEEVFRRMPHDGIEAVSFGVFRMHPDFLRRMRVFRRESILENGVIDREGVASYAAEIREEVFAFMTDLLARELPRERIHAVHG